MAYDLQAKLLRILESGEYIKIGETKPTKVNVRSSLQPTGIWYKKSKTEVLGKISLQAVGFFSDTVTCIKRTSRRYSFIGR